MALDDALPVIKQSIVLNKTKQNIIFGIIIGIESYEREDVTILFGVGGSIVLGCICLDMEVLNGLEVDILETKFPQ